MANRGRSARCGFRFGVVPLLPSVASVVLACRVSPSQVTPHLAEPNLACQSEPSLIPPRRDMPRLPSQTEPRLCDRFGSQLLDCLVDFFHHRIQFVKHLKPPPKLHRRPDRFGNQPIAGLRVG
jgi:hypothetical protein